MNEVENMKEDEDTVKLLQLNKAKWLASDKQCTACVYYVAEYKDDYTLKHFGYGQVKIRPACSWCGNYSFVSHNPAALCTNFKRRNK